jgi:hypothetical protein
MKQYFFIIITSLFLFGQYSCTDLLEQKPQGQWNEGDAIGGGFESAVFDIYALLRGFNVTSGNVAMAIHSFRSEDVEKGSTAADGSDFALMYDNFDYNTGNGAIANYWTANYAIIHAANNVISDIGSSTDAGEGTLINKAEAHFFRAFAYFNLVRAFGEVPLIDFKISDAREANIPKSPVAGIYRLIDADLAVATEFLPHTWERYPGRLTWGAARAFHARTYMMRSDWPNMYAASTEVINSAIYDLNTPFDKIFREDGENSSESVLELQCTSTTALPGSNETGSQFAEVQGVRGAGEWNLGWGWNTPTKILADAFENGDPRKDETLLYFYKSQAEADAPGAKANAPWGEKPVASSTVVNSYYNKKAYTNPTWRAQYTNGGYWVNIRIIRYADVVLMAAESANEQGNTSAALTYLEMVRSRARGSNTAILPKVTTTNQTLLRDAIRHERRIELAMEYDRFYDLVRWGTAAEVLHAAGKTNYQARHALLPIPQTEIDKSDGVLLQNPNY